MKRNFNINNYSNVHFRDEISHQEINLQHYLKYSFTYCDLNPADGVLGVKPQVIYSLFYGVAFMLGGDTQQPSHFG
jgi:hypothetical protein